MTAIVQILFEHSWTDQELHAAAKAFAEKISPNIPGLLWKMFAKETEASCTSGIYFFDSLESANHYVQSERIQGMKSSPKFKGVSVRVSETMEEESILAGAPL